MMGLTVVVIEGQVDFAVIQFGGKISEQQQGFRKNSMKKQKLNDSPKQAFPYRGCVGSGEEVSVTQHHRGGTFP